MPNPSSVSEILARVEEPATRLRDFIREQKPGGCRLLSQGESCQCPLCDMDRLESQLRAALQDVQPDDPSDYERLCRAIDEHLPQFVQDDDMSEVSIYERAIEQAGKTISDAAISSPEGASR